MSQEYVPLDCTGRWTCDCAYCVAERRFDLGIQDPAELDESQSEPIELRDPYEVALDACEERDTEPCPAPMFDD